MECMFIYAGWLFDNPDNKAEIYYRNLEWNWSPDIIYTGRPPRPFENLKKLDISGLYLKSYLPR